ncbi:ATP/GTP-binding protein [Streptomyces sp. NBC_00201]|uniref:ATP/GTP-binding protein n=1 Tax=unclassified Streptomyces TaxID=2593676 RepID=UPI002250799F|nr:MULTISPECIES: ATP/GTP-binding protein [unclassified Streptomyces]MCX5251950.1 ATP/GTP-binding protein [Streptomyces sp. NBC_00201]MCX5294131.1 ATP/GTP-binding protein [Streptomyces sp. NBC_00183]
MDGHEVDRSRAVLLTRRLAVLTGALVLASAGVTHAGDDPDVGAGKCQVIKFCVDVGVGDETRGSGGQAGGSQGGGDGSDSKVKCTYTKVDPKPPANHPAWKGEDPKKNDLYLMECSDGGQDNPASFVVVRTGQAPAPQVDPQVLAQRAVDSMTLLGPDLASPRAAGKYTVGVPMWMWVNESATTYGPNTASATAGGVTVTATAKVSKIVWAMGDGASVTCNGPGTPYTSSEGMAESPTCGHVYAKTSASAQSGKFPVTATSTWTINWQGGGQAGQLTEVRQTNVQVAIGEVQVVR